MSVGPRGYSYIFHISVYVSCQRLVVHLRMSFRLTVVSEVYQVARVFLLNGSGFCDELERLALT